MKLQGKSNTRTKNRKHTTRDCISNDSAQHHRCLHQDPGSPVTSAVQQLGPSPRPSFWRPSRQPMLWLMQPGRQGPPELQPQSPSISLQFEMHGTCVNCVILCPFRRDQSKMIIDHYSVYDDLLRMLVLNCFDVLMYKLILLHETCN